MLIKFIAITICTIISLPALEIAFHYLLYYCDKIYNTNLVEERGLNSQLLYEETSSKSWERLSISTTLFHSQQDNITLIKQFFIKLLDNLEQHKILKYFIYVNALNEASYPWYHKLFNYNNINIFSRDNFMYLNSFHKYDDLLNNAFTQHHNYDPITTSRIHLFYSTSPLPNQYGMMAHLLAHKAYDLVYKNYGLPFFGNTNNIAQNYIKIAKQSEALQHNITSFDQRITILEKLLMQFSLKLHNHEDYAKEMISIYLGNLDNTIPECNAREILNFSECLINKQRSINSIFPDFEEFIQNYSIPEFTEYISNHSQCHLLEYSPTIECI